MPTARAVTPSFRPLTPERWADVTKLFGPRGACAGCWCMWPRLRGAEFQRGKGEGNRRALRRLVEDGDPPGIIAYAGTEPIGWCAIAPREAYPRIESSRVLARVDERPVWSVVCFFVARGHRGAGLTVRLLLEAVRYARRRGARIVEGYPVDPKGRTADVFVWTGLASAFRAAGFVEVARRSPTRPIMRRVLRAGGGSRSADLRPAAATPRPAKRAASGRATRPAGRSARPAPRAVSRRLRTRAHG